MYRNKFSELSLEIHKTLEVVEVSRFINICKIARESIINTDEALQEYIISICCNAFSISKKDLISSDTTSRSKTDCISVCSYLLSFHLGMKQTKIMTVIKRDNSVISKYIKRISLLDINHPSDKPLIKTIDLLNEKINEFKIKIK